MNRSAGVTTAAVVTIIGSILTLVIGLLTLVSYLIMPVSTQAPNVPRHFMLFPVFLFLGCGAWGIATGIGLLKLWRWARISILVFSGLLVFFCAFGLLFAWIMPIPTREGVPPSVVTMTRAGMTMFCLLLTAVGVWWLVLFTRSKVKQQFLGLAPLAETSLRPLSITIIAWLLLIGCLLYIPLALLFRYPAVLMGMIFKGWSAMLVHFTWALAGAYVGLGLLRLKPSSHTLAIGYFLFGLLNGLTFVLVPGVRERLHALAVEDWPVSVYGSPPPPPQSPWLSVILILACIGIPLWFLVTRRARYLEAARSRTPTT